MFNPEVLGTLIGLVAVIGYFITKWLSMNLQHDRRGVIDDKLADELRESLRRLEERVSNLERAVTTAESERRFAL